MLDAFDPFVLRTGTASIDPDLELLVARLDRLADLLMRDVLDRTAYKVLRDTAVVACGRAWRWGEDSGQPSSDPLPLDPE